MVLKYVQFLLVISLLVTSCDEPCDLIDCQNNATCNLGVCDCPIGYEGETCELSLNLIKEIILNDKLFRSFEYDSLNILDKVIEYRGENTITHIYNHFIFPDSTLVCIEDFQLARKITYLFDHSRQESLIVTSEDEGNYIFTRKYTDKQANCGYTERDQSSANINPFLYIIDYDANCNYTRSVFNQAGSLIQTEEVMLDGAKNIYQYDYYHVFEFDHPYIQNGGNFVNRNVFDEVGDIIVGFTFNSVFEYNDNGMPISQTQNFANGITQNFEYVYY